MTTKLWQRNVIGAVVSAVALSLVVYFTPWPAWQRYRSTVDPAHTVAVDDAVTISGQTWELGTVRTAGRGRGAAPAPEGAVTKVVTVQRSGPADPELICYAVLTDGRSRWRAFGTSCGKPGPLTWSFVLPADTDPTAVDITGPDGAILIRFLL